MNLVVVILAAGAGSRLAPGGVAKALLPIEDTTYLARIASTARAAGAVEIVAVIAEPHGARVREQAESLAVRVIENPDPSRGMASSVALGFAALAQGDAAFLWPVDHPHVQRETLVQLSATLGNREVSRPRFGGRGGHPPLIARSAWSALAACADVDGGARAVIAGLDVIEVEVDDPGVVRDIDTPADLEAAS